MRGIPQVTLKLMIPVSSLYDVRGREKGRSGTQIFSIIYIEITFKLHLKLYNLS